MADLRKNRTLAGIALQALGLPAFKVIWRQCRPLCLIFLAGVGVTGLAGWCMLHVDIPLAVWLANKNIDWHRNNLVVQSFRQFGKVHLIIWLLLLWGWLTRRSRFFLLGILTLMALAPAILPIKMATQRYRPKIMFKTNSYSPAPFCLRTGRLAFPSGDTATVFAMATIMTATLDYSTGWALFYFCLAAGVGGLRMVSLDHYLSDVIAGAALGVLAGQIVISSMHFLDGLKNRWLDGFWHHYAPWILILFPFVVSFFENYNPIFIFLRGYGVVLLPVVAHYRFHCRHDRWNPSVL